MGVVAGATQWHSQTQMILHLFIVDIPLPSNTYIIYPNEEGGFDKCSEKGDHSSCIAKK